MVDFDPNDDNLPQKLRNHFTTWDTAFALWADLLNLKFPDAVVQPQGLMRPIMSEHEVEIVVGKEGLLDVGDVSIDSTGQYVSKQEQKCYPDFIVASYYEDEEKYYKIRLILEIGSLHKREAMVLLGREGARWATNGLAWLQLRFRCVPEMS